MKDESIRYCIKFSKSFDVADVPEAESELTAMQARIEALEHLEAIAQDVNTWLISNGMAGTAHQLQLEAALKGE